jgi:flagellar hook-basal body complex protein FliE
MADPLGLISGSSGMGGVGPSRVAPSSKPLDAGQPTFRDVLLKNIEEVNKLQQDAVKAVEDLQTGQRADVENVLTATAKADLAFKMLQAVRNQVMRAYDEVQQMRV